MYKTAWLFFISLFGFCLVTIVFINYTTWTGLYLSTGQDLTYTYFGFTSLLTMVADLQNFYESHSSFMSMKTLSGALNYYWEYAGGFYGLLATLGNIVQNGVVSSTDIIKLITNLVSMVFISISGPMFIALILIVIGYWFISYGFIMVTIVINALQGAYNVSMSSTDYMPSIIESVSALLKSPYVSPYGVQGVSQAIHPILNNVIYC